MPDEPTAAPAPEPDPSRSPDPNASRAPDVDDAKVKFRQALERKKQTAHDSVDDSRHGESVHGRTDTHQHGGKREFRRKAGP